MPKLNKSKSLEMNKIRWQNSVQLSEYPWEEITHDNLVNKLDTNDIIEKYNISRGKLTRAKKSGLFNYTPPKRKVVMSEETKRKISKGRKKFLKENPDKHPWRSKDKFQSKPCEHLKQKLTELNIDFIDEFIPLDDRSFSIDIAFPSQLIAIEVNGEQHYERTGELKPYYQERHDLLVENGWTVYELHYSLVWNNNLIDDILKKIKNADHKVDFDFEEYCRNKLNKSENKCPSCGKIIYRTSSLCVKCNNKNKNKNNIEWPSNDELSKLVWTKPLIKLGEDLGVSETSIRKRCKKYNIQTPPRGYWLRNGKR